MHYIMRYISTKKENLEKMGGSAHTSYAVGAVVIAGNFFSNLPMHSVSSFQIRKVVRLPM